MNLDDCSYKNCDRLTHCALLVQLVERRSPKPDVGGSSPPGRAETYSARKHCQNRKVGKQ
jgi:hypothetical protein